VVSAHATSGASVGSGDGCGDGLVSPDGPASGDAVELVGQARGKGLFGLGAREKNLWVVALLKKEERKWYISGFT
jgi:hypothetical protein